ncbi:MAG TPA: trigger factor [Smithella sp.]|nr:trigger factor [Smithella sp.]HOU52066.1 trigger factor [Smithella sp.]HQG64956.1 trigger factor [Smithella sp.]HQH16495.1 trigger factor [Smithella sp.]HQI74040.1 trigger factor [Smithella sp.]
MSQVVVKIEDLSPVKKKMSLEIPWSEVKGELDAAYQEIGKKAKLKGFRQGKIPRKILETYFKDQAENEASTNIVNKYYWQTLEDKGIIAISRPDVHQEGIKENADYTFSATFETEPEIEPKNYKGIELEKEKIIVTDEDVRKRVDEIRQMFATMEEVTDDRPVMKGDYVVMDFSGSLNGESYKELNAQDYFLEIGSGKFVPGFEDQLVGMKKGENREIKVKFPADYHESRFADKEVVFNVTVKSMREKRLPEDDDSFIKNFERYNTFDDFKADVRKSLEEKAEQMSKVNLQNSITDKLIKENDFEVPESMVERQIFFMMAEMQKRMMSAGIDENSAIDFSLKMHDKYKGDAEKTVKAFLLLKKIGTKESLTVEDSDLDQYIQEMAAQNGHDYDSMKKMYESEEKKDYLRIELIQKKVFDFIEQNANIKVVEKTGMNAEAKQ